MCTRRALDMHQMCAGTCVATCVGTCVGTCVRTCVKCVFRHVLHLHQKCVRHVPDDGLEMWLDVCTEKCLFLGMRWQMIAGEKKIASWVVDMEAALKVNINNEYCCDNTHADTTSEEGTGNERSQDGLFNNAAKGNMPKRLTAFYYYHFSHPFHLEWFDQAWRIHDVKVDQTIPSRQTCTS